ncbi:hypothetical protein K2173_020855 [Erythroxylum novogranatense]|uniref:Pre-mRNA polyadenylation factor Fip1 domain-containing protein n=1 Tax=Erythroxylum novogranatense TaxID=1862640 RepID=A0AAV8TNV0_9ROSI|nr:hypothetical protein K2173_020855 [Erythroxylum novogranatense]
MEDEDEFGDLYTDVLPPFSSSALPTHASAPGPQPPHRPIDLNLLGDQEDDEILYGSSRAVSNQVPSVSPPKLGPSGPASAAGPRVLVPLAATNNDANSRDLSGFQFEGDDKDVKFDIEDTHTIEDSAPAIPGLSVSVEDSAITVRGGAETGGEREEDSEEEDSDSEDDLQIVLNDNNHGPMGMKRGVDDDEGDEDNFVIVADGEPNQPIEEQDWGGGEDATVVGAEGERKEGGEAAGKGNAMVVPKIGYSGHPYHHSFHSQFKYVRPGAAPIPGATTFGPGGAPGQVRPPISMGAIPGRGRGDWRPTGMKSGPQMQKGFHPGYGTAWGNNMAGRGYGGGLEFTLPSHKTIFDVDIDSFEEKPWKYPVVDISDFFNFGLNEESWKDYCKQLEQHRLETTMQSKIRVYESGRTEQEYDPDLPPELAAASGIDVPVDNSNLGKTEAGQNDLAKGSARVRPPIPTGRAIQVETGYGERLPSIDTRPPRVRDSDAIIEIICQDSLDDDSSAGNGMVDGEANDPPRDDFRRSREAENDTPHKETEYVDDLPQAYVGQRGGRRPPYMDSVQDSIPDGEARLPFRPEASGQYHPGSRKQPPMYPSGDVGTSSIEGRRIQGRPLDRSPRLSVSGSSRDRKFLDNVEEESVESKDNKHSSALSSPVLVKDGKDLSTEEKDDTPAELVLAEASSGMEKDEVTENEETIVDTLKDGNKNHSVNRRITNSRSDQSAARSSENSKGRSGSSKDYQKWQDVEEEVVQGGRSSRRGSVKRHLDENERDLRRRDHDMRQEMERSSMFSKGREGSYPRRDSESTLAQHLHIKTEGYDRRKDREIPDGSWQRRDEDPHLKKVRNEDTRKRDRGDDIGLRHRSKIRENERTDKDEHPYSRKQMYNGSYRVPYDKDGSSRHRERDDSSKSRYEIGDDYHSKRKKDEDYLRRDHLDKDEILLGHRENTSRRRRERDDAMDPRKRDDQQRIRDNLDDYHSARHKDEVWLHRDRGERPREREEMYRLKQSHEENSLKREREEGRGSMRSGRGTDDKAWSSNNRIKNESKVSDKEYHLKDAVRNSEQQKGRDRLEEENLSHHRGYDDSYIRGNTDEKRSRQERSSTQIDRAMDMTDSQKMQEKKLKENTRKNKVSEGDRSASGSSRRNHDDQSGHPDEMGLKNINGQGGGHNEIPVRQNPSKRRKEDASSDEEQLESRRGRSKLERWTSHKERDYSISSKASASLKFKGVDKNNNGGSSEASKHADEPSKRVEAVQSHTLAEEKAAGDIGNKDSDTKPVEDKHLDTVEKLKKRSERFKLPMPSDKDALAIKKIETEVLPAAKTDNHTDSEVKPERPARKRRWIGN